MSRFAVGAVVRVRFVAPAGHLALIGVLLRYLDEHRAEVDFGEWAGVCEVWISRLEEP